MTDIWKNYFFKDNERNKSHGCMESTILKTCIIHLEVILSISQYFKLSETSDYFFLIFNFILYFDI